MKDLIKLALIGLFVWLGYLHYKPKITSAFSTTSSVTQEAAPSAARETTSRFKCDGRTHCSHMRSCEEAKYFIKHCPNTKMDGDSDGIPCERQWCN